MNNSPWTLTHTDTHRWNASSFRFSFLVWVHVCVCVSLCVNFKAKRCVFYCESSNKKENGWNVATLFSLSLLQRPEQSPGSCRSSPKKPSLTLKNRSRESQHLIRPFSMRLASSLSMIGILASINPVRRSWPCANPIGMFQHHFLFHADGWDHFHVGSFHYTLISGGIFHWAPSGASASLNAWPVASRPILRRLFPVAFIPSLLLLLPHLVPK